MQSGSPFLRRHGKPWVAFFAGVVLTAWSRPAFAQSASTRPSDPPSDRPAPTAPTLRIYGTVALPAPAAPAAPRAVRAAAAPAVQGAGARDLARDHDEEGFSVRKGDPVAADLLAAFDEAVRARAWAKAFDA